MDRTLSWLAGAGSADDVEHALFEVDAAITMVVLGAARSVRLCNLPGAEAAAFDAAARAQTAEVSFSLQRDGVKSVTLVIGPSLQDGSKRSSRPATAGDVDPRATA